MDTETLSTKKGIYSLQSKFINYGDTKIQNLIKYENDVAIYKTVDNSIIHISIFPSKLLHIVKVLRNQKDGEFGLPKMIHFGNFYEKDIQYFFVLL